MSQDLNSEAASGHGRSWRAGRAKALPVSASWGKEARVAGVECAGMGPGWWQMRLERQARARSCRLLRHKFLWRNEVICSVSHTSWAVCLILEPELTARLEFPAGEDNVAGPGNCTFCVPILTQMSSPRRAHQALMSQLTVVPG